MLYTGGLEMFTPEIINESNNEFILVANHNIESIEQLKLSIQYNKSRINYGKSHLPSHINICRLIYDLRGQNVADDFQSKIIDELSDIATLEFKI
ncbi:MAG: hypothetical protein P8Y35_00630 [Sulfurovaceae bacterium]